MYKTIFICSLYVQTAHCIKWYRPIKYPRHRFKMILDKAIKTKEKLNRAKDYTDQNRKNGQKVSGKIFRTFHGHLSHVEKKFWKNIIKKVSGVLIQNCMFFGPNRPVSISGIIHEPSRSFVVLLTQCSLPIYFIQQIYNIGATFNFHHTFATTLPHFCHHFATTLPLLYRTFTIPK